MWTNKPGEPYEIRIYPGEDACFTIYEDRGGGYEYENGAYAVYTLQWTEKDRVLSISVQKGGFDEMCSQIFRLPNQEKKYIMTDKEQNQPFYSMMIGSGKLEAAPLNSL